ncbi:MAG TPA: hypothetical protein VIC59_11390 [Gemmatimonadota bacterium]
MPSLASSVTRSGSLHPSSVACILQMSVFDCGRSEPAIGRVEMKYSVLPSGVNETSASS